jgi:hypothetical protein
VSGYDDAHFGHLKTARFVEVKQQTKTTKEPSLMKFGW